MGKSLRNDRKHLRLRWLFSSKGRKRKGSDDKIPSNKTIVPPDTCSGEENHFVVRIPDIQKRIYLTLLIQHLQTDKKRSKDEGDLPLKSPEE